RHARPALTPTPLPTLVPPDSNACETLVRFATSAQANASVRAHSFHPDTEYGPAAKAAAVPPSPLHQRPDGGSGTTTPPCHNGDQTRIAPGVRARQLSASREVVREDPTPEFNPGSVAWALLPFRFAS